jgi:hypothetical protein
VGFYDSPSSFASLPLSYLPSSSPALPSTPNLCAAHLPPSFLGHTHYTVPRSQLHVLHSFVAMALKLTLISWIQFSIQSCFTIYLSIYLFSYIFFGFGRGVVIYAYSSFPSLPSPPLPFPTRILTLTLSFLAVPHRYHTRLFIFLFFYLVFLDVDVDVDRWCNVLWYR